MNAIMIMCHRDFDQVSRLVHRCISDNTRIILHIDCKAEISEQEIISKFGSLKGKGVYLTEKRSNGMLDDKSLVEIALLMVEKAHQIETEENLHFQYYLLLSGQDYLTKPIDYINDQLKVSYPKAFLDCDPYDRNSWIYGKFNRNPFCERINYFLRMNFKKKNLLWAGIKSIELLFRKSSQLLRLTDYHYFKRRSIELYGGSAWWVLPDAIIAFIEKEYEADKKQWRRLLQSVTPEEVFFQTLAMQSPLAHTVEVKPKAAVGQNCKTWAYFYDDDKPARNHPYIFTEKEYDKLINRDCWFARKFDSKVDSKIFDLLDNWANDSSMVIR